MTLRLQLIAGVSQSAFCGQNGGRPLPTSFAKQKQMLAINFPIQTSYNILDRFFDYTPYPEVTINKNIQPNKIYQQCNSFFILHKKKLKNRTKNSMM